MEPGLDLGAERVASRPRRTRAVGQEAMLDPTLPEKQRARRRLVGAIALVLAAVIILPMVLDATPKPTTGDIAIDIPDQGQSAAPAARGNAALESGADAVHQDIVGSNVSANADGGAKSPAAAGEGKSAAAQRGTPATADAAPQRFAQVYDSPSAASDNGASSSAGAGSRGGATSSRAAANAATSADNDLATRVAALPATPATPGARYVVQLGSFESAASAQEWVKKLKRIGVPAFVNTDKGNDGVTHVQLRAGPFADRTVAQAAVQKVRLAGLTQTADAGSGR